MREIKFRGKRVDNGEWVYGYFVKAWDGTCYIITEFGSDVTCCSDCGCNDMTVHEVDPDTVGQFTGLHDKHGKEIYEGDIIQTYFSFAPGDAGYGVSQKPFVVKWEQVRAGLRAYKPNADRLHLLDIVDFWETQSSLYEVIGNIYDNPELMEVSE